MKRSDELKELREEKFSAMEALQKKAEQEKRTLLDDEQTQFDALRSEIEKLEKSISDAIFMEEQQRKRAKNESDQRRSKEKASPEQKLTKAFSLIRAINQVAGKGLEGAELEAFQETQNEYRKFSRSLDGNIGSPSFRISPE